MGPLLLQLAALLAWTHALQALGRRLGPHRTGLLLGLPARTAVALVACGYECGPEAATAMATAGLLGLVPASAFSLTCAAALRRGWGLARALGAGLGAYAALALALGLLPALGDGGRLAVAAALLALAARSRGQLPAEGAPDPSGSEAGRAGRLLIPAACLALLTALREAAGPAWAGLLAPFPAATLALLVATYAGAGRRAACRLAAAVPRGAPGTLAFLAVFGGLGPRIGPAPAAATGYLAALVVLGIIEWATGPGAAGKAPAVGDAAAYGGGQPHPGRRAAAGCVRPGRRSRVGRPGARFAPRLEALGS